MGYTEPDPRDDLSGMDVARKVVILGREIGLEIGLEDVVVESLIPSSLQGVSLAEYLNRIHEGDDHLLTLFRRAHGENKVLRYVGSIRGDGRAEVGLVALAETHAFGRIQLTDNIVQFTTDRYAENPLVVQGPGAGPAVTAGGVFGDILRLAAHLGTSR